MTTRRIKPLEPRQVLNLWTRKAAAHPMSAEAAIAEANNTHGSEYYNCWRCRRTERKPEIPDDIRGRRAKKLAEQHREAQWLETIAKHEAGDCLRIPKVRKRIRLRRRGDVPRCGAVHPDFARVTCTAHAIDEQGAPHQHRGKHRAKLTGGAVIRWDATAKAGAR
jgi:hypothetical protein